MRGKLGLRQEEAADDELIREFLGLLQASRADYTIVFRELGSFSTAEDATNEKLREHFLGPDRFDEWAGRYRDRLRKEDSRDDERTLRMNAVNPKYVLRNYLAQAAIEKAQQRDFSEIDRPAYPAAGPLQRSPWEGQLCGVPAQLGQAHQCELLVLAMRLEPFVTMTDTFLLSGVVACRSEPFRINWLERRLVAPPHVAVPLSVFVQWATSHP